VVLSDLLCTDYGLELKRDGAAGRWKMSCPFHGEKTPSCTVYDNDASFHCFGCGKGGDVFALVQHLDGLTFPQAAEKLAARAGMSLNGSNGQLATTKPKADAPQPEADLSERWRGAVVAFTDAHVETLATWRGLSLDFCRWLRERELVGLHNSLVAFPVHGDNGTVTAFHVRTKDGSKWFYEPSGAKVRPLVIGDVKAAEYVGAFESQWDAFAVLDKIGWHVGGDGLPGWAVVVTRGAGNAKLLGGLLRPSATAFAFAQNDEPGQDWLQDVADKRRLHSQSRGDAKGAQGHRRVGQGRGNAGRRERSN
jgi:hypothetical protein